MKKLLYITLLITLMSCSSKSEHYRVSDITTTIHEDGSYTESWTCSCSMGQYSKYDKSGNYFEGGTIGYSDKTLDELAIEWSIEEIPNEQNIETKNKH